MASKKQIGYIKGLAKVRGIEVDSRELEALTTREADRMIRELLGRKTATPSEGMKNKIISMARTIGWEVNGRIDMMRLNAWCQHKGQYKKPLDAHDAKELPHLVTQFQLGPFAHAMTRN